MFINRTIRKFGVSVGILSMFTTVVPVTVINEILGAYVNWTTIDKTLTANVSLSKKQ